MEEINGKKISIFPPEHGIDFETGSYLFRIQVFLDSIKYCDSFSN